MLVLNAKEVLCMNMLTQVLRPWNSGFGITITPELVKASEDGSEIFYRYGINDTHKVWFTQMQDSGNIYSVSISAKQGVTDEFEYYASGQHTDDYYPNRFVLRGPSRNMTVEDTGLFIEDMKRAQNILHGIQRFFETGVHALKYWAERANEAIMHTNLGDYDLGGVEFTHDDCEEIARRVVAGESLDTVVHQYLLDTRELLDAGLDDLEEEL
jgi:hypothetical protein